MMNLESVKASPIGLAYEMIESFVDTTPAQRLLMALWSAHTHTYRKFHVSPRLAFMAEGPGTGKTTAMNVALALSNEPLAVGYISQPALVSWLDQHPQTTLGLDEIDKVFGIAGRKTSRPVLASIVNDGYTSSGMAMVQRQSLAVQVPIYCPVATAGLGNCLPDDTRTRAIVIRMEQGQPLEDYIPEEHADMLAMIGRETARWLSTKDVRESVVGAPSSAEITGTPRERQIMAPLCAIADAAGIGDIFRAAVKEWQTGESDSPVMSTAEAFAAAVRPLLTDEPATAEAIASALPGWKIPTDRAGATLVTSLLREAGMEPIKSNGKYGFRKTVTDTSE